MPNMYIVAGCNGAGKTTASFTILPEILNCREFVNADEIARGLSPFQPATVSFQAGRIMITRIKELIKSNVDFGFETTLATKSYQSLVEHVKTIGYEVVLVFMWLESSALAKERVRFRVLRGGHNIPDEVIERRYERGLNNFFTIYSGIVSRWLFLDNSRNEPMLIAKGQHNEVIVVDSDVWTRLKP